MYWHQKHIEFHQKNLDTEYLLTIQPFFNGGIRVDPEYLVKECRTDTIERGKFEFLKDKIAICNNYFFKGTTVTVFLEKLRISIPLRMERRT